MGKYAGIVNKNELEGGFWELVCEDGRRFALANPDGGLKRHGLRVEVDGKVDEDAMGIGMSGPLLVVRSYRVV